MSSIFTCRLPAYANDLLQYLQMCFRSACSWTYKISALISSKRNALIYLFDMELQVVLEGECLRTELALKWIFALFEIELG